MSQNYYNWEVPKPDFKIPAVTITIYAIYLSLFPTHLGRATVPLLALSCLTSLTVVPAFASASPLSISVLALISSSLS